MKLGFGVLKQLSDPSSEFSICKSHSPNKTTHRLGLLEFPLENGEVKIKIELVGRGELLISKKEPTAEGMYTHAIRAI